MSEIKYDIPTNGRFVDLKGRKYGRLLVEEFAYSKDGRSYWKCKCDCGNECIKQGHALGNNTKSCGCLHLLASIKNGEKNRKHNEYDLSGEYGIGYTSKGEQFYFDLEDYDKIKDYYWSLNHDGYVYNSSKRTTNHFLHRLVLNDIPHNDNNIIDHINRNKLDNRKENLRWCNFHQNCLNRKIKSTNTSGQTNVYFKYNKWYVKIKTKEHNFYQTCDSYEEACDLARAKRKEFFKEYYCEEKKGN